MMGDNSAIEWTDATWNPIVGCSIVSAGCSNCYAMTMASRISRMMKDREGHSGHYFGLTKTVNSHAIWTGKLALAPERILTAPLRWRRERRIFVNSMGDLFHEDAPDEWIDRVFAIMALAPQHTFQVLTKRSRRMREYLTADRRHEVFFAAVDVAPPFSPIAFAWPLRNCWLGVSAEDQPRADERIPDLLATPAAVRFVSAEPLLGGIDFQPWIGRIVRDHISHGEPELLVPYSHLDWIIVGGESGPRARYMIPDWAQSILDQCAAAGTPFFMKQMAKKGPIPDYLMVREYPKEKTTA